MRLSPEKPLVDAVLPGRDPNATWREGASPNLTFTSGPEENLTAKALRRKDLSENDARGSSRGAKDESSRIFASLRLCGERSLANQGNGSFTK